MQIVSLSVLRLRVIEVISLSTGGLGPTEDDLTKQTLAHFWIET